MASAAEKLAAEINQLQELHRSLQASEERQKAEAEKSREKVLVGASPVKKAPSVAEALQPGGNPQPRFAAARLPAQKELPSFSQPLPGPSSLGNSFARTYSHSNAGQSLPAEASSGIKGNFPVTDRSLTPAELAVKRHQESLRIIEELELGPKDFGTDLQGSKAWKKVEPNSGLNLKTRKLAHSQVQANLDSRYHVSPSVLYAICHVSRDGSAYKVPLDADWVTIAVVCDATHRTSQGKEYERSEWDSDDEERQLQRELSGQAPDPERAKKRKRTAVGRKGKSFTIFKLTTVPSRASGLEAGGDAMVNLLLYEADSVRQGPDGKVHYKGGSGGAWEEWHSKLSVGSVIAVMNPKVIKPYGKGNTTAHPLSNPVGLIPSSHTDIWHIGVSQDISTCSALTRERNRCTKWVDLRLSEHCEFHVTGSIKKKKAGRAEFASSTSGFDIVAAAAPYTKPLDPKARRGLLSRFGAGSATDSGGQTYIVEGSVFSTGPRAGDQFIGDTIGRDKDMRFKRRREAEEAERDLEELLKRDRDSSTTGGRYLEAAERIQNAAKGESAAAETSQSSLHKPRPFHAAAIKRLGFDPTLSHDSKLSLESGQLGKQRLEAISALQGGRKGPIKLGPLPGLRNKSNAKVPFKQLPIPVQQANTATEQEDELYIDLDSDDE